MDAASEEQGNSDTSMDENRFINVSEGLLNAPEENKDERVSIGGAASSLKGGPVRADHNIDIVQFPGSNTVTVCEGNSTSPFVNKKGLIGTSTLRRY